MKKYLALIFLITNSFIESYDGKNHFLEAPFNTTSDALGGTGMIFGEEYSSFYLAPTSLQKEEIKAQFVFGLDIPAPLFDPKFANNFKIKYLLFTKTKIGNFSLGFLGFQHFDVPFCYSLKIYNFSLGIGLKYVREIVYGEYLFSSIGGAYESIIGNFSISSNNFLLKNFNDPDYLFSIKSLKPNLRLGFAKKFEMNYIFNELQLAFEIGDLLINNFSSNKKHYDLYLYNRLHLGIEILKYIENVNLALRVGIKNLFPTFGIGLEIYKCLKIEYAFTNRIDRKFKNKIVNLLSLEGKLNNLLYFSNED